MKFKFRTAIVYLSLIIAGALLTLFTLAFFSKQKVNDEELKRKFASDYAELEQKRVGVNCTQLTPNKITEFLHSNVRPVIEARKNGEPWADLVSTDLKSALTRFQEFINTCSRLYSAGEAGKLNGLESLNYIEKTQRTFTDIATLLLYADRSKELCNEKCLDQKFNVLKESYQSLISLLR